MTSSPPHTESGLRDLDSMISTRAKAIDVSGIRRVFELGAKLADPINLSIGQPDFPVPEAIKADTIEALARDRNGYTLTQGAPELLDAVSRRLAEDVGWTAPSDDTGLMITSGTSGALMLACLALLDPGDEIVVPDPFFVIYPALGEIAGARAVMCDTYPDLRMTAERLEPLLTERTKIVLLNSPGNPSGVVLTGDEVREVAELCERRGVLLVSDEIYDEFTYADAREDGRCPSPARFTQRMLLVRGFGKTYGCTGWRLGYVAGPAPVIRQMAKLQQYTFVCAPSMAQVGMASAFDVDMSEHVAAYERKRDMVCAAFDGRAELVRPGGAFYAFVRVPETLGLTATAFAEQAIERNVLVIPGGVFSGRDTHLRITFATSDEKLRQGLEILASMCDG
jgi:aspartate/methionine/tyrosine aminotransferase